MKKIGIEFMIIKEEIMIIKTGLWEIVCFTRRFDCKRIKSVVIRAHVRKVLLVMTNFALILLNMIAKTAVTKIQLVIIPSDLTHVPVRVDILVMVIIAMISTNAKTTVTISVRTDFV